jgi:cell division protein FtsQ
MSREGKWRRAMAALRVVLLAGFVLAAVAGALWVVSTLTAGSSVPAIAKAAPMKAPELRTSRDGALDNTWLGRTLALPANASLMEIDLEKLRARVLADGQVVTANVTRTFPDKLTVTVTERVPVARVRVESAGEPRDLLVARDGVVFSGYGFDRGMIESLPWLAGIALVPDGTGFKPIPGISTVAQLLADAQFAAAHLYANWQSVSLARLDADRQLVVTTKDGSTIVFGASGDYYLQLLRLDTIAERLEMLPGSKVRVDLSLGREVPVTVEPPAVPETRGRSGKPKAPESIATRLSLPLTQPKKQP